MAKDGKSDDGEYTTDVNSRLRFTNDIMALGFVLAIIVWVTYFLVVDSSVPTWLQVTVALGALSAIVWAFGKGVFKTALDAVQGGEK